MEESTKLFWTLFNTPYTYIHAHTYQSKQFCQGIENWYWNVYITLRTTDTFVIISFLLLLFTFFRFYRSKKMPQNAMAWYWCSSIWESRQRCCKTFYWSLEFYEGVIMLGKFVLHFCIRRERQTFFPFLFKLCHHLMPLNLASKLICLRNNFYIVLPTPQFTHFYFSMRLTVC